MNATGTVTSGARSPKRKAEKPFQATNEDLKLEKIFLVLLTIITFLGFIIFAFFSFKWISGV
jgi:hypothetical protein